MQIEVRDGSRILWVEEFACFLENGELAFSYHESPDIVSPDWFGAPESSVVREERRSNNPEHPNEELRSMQSRASGVLEFFRERVLRGGLVAAENVVADHALRITDLSRLEPGFYADSNDYHLNLDVYEHRGLSFWRVKYGPKLPSGFRSKREPKYLVFGGEINGRVILRNPDTNDELWAPPAALTECPPDHPDVNRSSPEKVRISWMLLPDWIQIKVVPETEVTACSLRGKTLVGFSSMRLATDIRTDIDRLLEQLDTFGFDATGIHKPDHSYYLRPMTGGRHIEVCVHEKSGDRASLTFVDTHSGPMVYAHYQTQRTLGEFLGKSE
jgi:hypothetical protein